MNIKIKLKAITNEFICDHCNKIFTRKYNLQRHLENNRCVGIKINQSDEQTIKLPHEQIVHDKITLLEKRIIELTNNTIASKNETDQQIAELRKKPNVNNQVLQVIALGPQDNYLDLLTKKWGNFDRALTYIKDCALSEITGDCKLIEKIYCGGLFDDAESPTSIHFLDKNRTKIGYYNEKNELMVSSKELFGKRIANNLQNSYLKGINHLIETILENRACPNKFLEEYDVQLWNQHIYNLSDCAYQKKMVNHLNIPLKSN
jgi:hypothetical protein